MGGSSLGKKWPAPACVVTAQRSVWRPLCNHGNVNKTVEGDAINWGLGDRRNPAGSQPSAFPARLQEPSRWRCCLSAGLVNSEFLPEPPCPPEMLSMDLFIEFNATEEHSMKKIFPFSLNVSWLSHF